MAYSMRGTRHDIHLCEGNRGTPEEDCCDRDEFRSLLASLGCKGRLAIESVTRMTPGIACGPAVWRAVDNAFGEVTDKAHQVLRNKAAQYRLT